MNDAFISVVLDDATFFIMCHYLVHGRRLITVLSRTVIFGDTAVDTCLVQSFIGETRVLEIADEELAETEIDGFDHSAQSIWCGNVGSEFLVQVTLPPHSLSLLVAHNRCSHESNTGNR